MKAITTILLTLLVLGGCAAPNTQQPIFNLSAYSNEGLCHWMYDPGNQTWGSLRSMKFRLNEYIRFLEESYERNIDCQSYIKKEGLNSISWMEQVVFNPNYTFHFDTSRMNELQILRTKYQEKKKERIIAQQKKDEELLLFEKQVLIKSRKEKCRTYGFKDETDGMGMCLIELDKLAEIEKQTKSIEANSIAQAEAIAQQEAKEKNRREAQALINLGNALSGKGKASCSFKCSGGQVVQGSCQKVTVSVGSQTCWKQ